MSDLCTVSLSARLTRDPELRHTPSGLAVVDLPLAYNTGRKNGDEWVEDSNFIDATFFGKRAEFFADRLSKGSLVFVHGRLKYESWEAQDGSKRSKHKIMGDDLKSPDLFRTNGGGSSSSSPSDPFVPAAAADDDIPF